ncbi:RNA 3'-phosphate cyclase [Pyrolobus fumarii 1A]|uniref:RNA 3'-terminal phosphate cyclase n=1 Tax=Pyrolobus fumarii (strain DSM 11204 / 1A) TaxID=694429 RepID=G0EEW5_PYRF1|nr:RNA 3'-terminal phosphate cyclase [Pyrolobus fumarii]AEM38079.1 RNA 3'-phosphate cyclase [Pyrolobus fumarii 1A]
MREVVIDGSMGEGGGQILRTSVALAAVLGIKLRVYNIRAKRKNPGLQRQHMTAIRAVAALTNARVEGLKLGSTSIVFEPRELRGGKYRFDIGTAGSVTLVLQALLPVAAFVPEPLEVEIRGGTDVPWSPPVDYVRFVLRPLLEKFGYHFDIIVKRRGHYPKGGGIVIFRVDNPPRRLHSIELEERGEVLAFKGLSHCVRLPKHVAERQARSAASVIRARYPDVPLKIDLEYYTPGKDPHLGPGSGIVVYAETENSVLGGDSLGAKGKPAERVGEEAARKLIEDLETGKALDRHASDMLIPFAALAEGESVLGGAKLTLHAYTNLLVVEKLTGIKYELKGELDKPFTLRIRGIGLTS